MIQDPHSLLVLIFAFLNTPKNITTFCTLDILHTFTSGTTSLRSFLLHARDSMIQSNTPAREQEHLQLSQVAQSLIQIGLKHFHGWGNHSFSGQPVPVPHQSRRKFVPYIYFKSTIFSFKTTTPSPISTGLTRMFVPIFLTGPL